MSLVFLAKKKTENLIPSTPSNMMHQTALFLPGYQMTNPTEVTRVLCL